ncbi:hypothetical protein MSAN_01981500 [Mycena sanguinolenta]|uniref:Uncharacterized protein n=1 Tax=Mycena sanguinolenta TaxID=230812 RepID=A0A8H6XNQ4_9AGAR|nr:hypothetical protein MSAN_01981500 [Mycena sanguinolenta]
MAPAAHVLPLKWTRLISLVLAWLLAVTALGAVVNLAIQGKKVFSEEGEIPSFVKINISANDLIIPAVISIISVIIVFAVSTLALIFLLLDIRRIRRTRIRQPSTATKGKPSTRMLTFQYLFLDAFGFVGIVDQIVLAVVIRTHSPSIHASASVLGLNIPIPDSILNLGESALGVQTSYKSFSFPTIAFLATRRVKRLARLSSSSVEVLTENEKARGKFKDKLPAIPPEEDEVEEV